MSSKVGFFEGNGEQPGKFGPMLAENTG